MNGTPQIPQSQALVEAGVESLSDLMSRNRETHTREDRDRIRAALREQRARWEATESQGKRPPRAAKVGVPKGQINMKIDL